jgi:hypothetical protein
MTRWKTQTNLHDPENGIEGNCTQAAIASLLGLELDEVPDFNLLHKDDPHAGFYWKHLDDWFAERGWSWQMRSKDYQPLGLYLADGKTERGTFHFVVMENGEMVHDVHPSRAGLLAVSHVWVLLPLDPAKFAFQA